MTDIQQNNIGSAEIEAFEAEAAFPMIRQIRIDKTNLIVEATETNIAVEGFIEVSAEVFQQAMPLVGRARFIDGEVVPLPPPPPPPIVLSAEVLFFDRMTADEYDDLDASIAANERAGIVRGWRNANSFTEGTAMWDLLVKYLTPDPQNPPRWAGVSDERRAELLARP